MRIVVVGGTGRLGAPVVAELERRGHDVVAASPRTGFDTLSGAGVADGLAGADVVIDVSNAPTFEPAAVDRFFQTSTGTLLAAERQAGTGHHVLISIVGADRAPDSGYLAAKVAQERLVERGDVPFTIVRATQFLEFLGQIADSFTTNGTVRAPSAHLQPIAVADLAEALADVAEAPPLDAVIEIGGPESVALDELIRRVFVASGDARPVITDDEVPYFGARLGPTTLTPGPGARLGSTTLDAWLRQA